MNKLTEHIVNGTRVMVWHPKPTETSFSISLKSGGWLVGSYDSVESALAGAFLDLYLVEEFYTLQKEINRFDKQNRLISLSDLEDLLNNHSAS